MKRLIFDTEEFIKLHSPDRIFTFRFTLNNKHIEIAVPIRKNCALLPIRGSYSFFSFEKRFSLNEINSIVENFELVLRTNNVTRVEFIFPPTALNTLVNNFYFIMSARGWSSGKHSISSVVNLSGNFIEKFSVSARQNLKKSQKIVDVNLVSVNCEEEWKKAYDCILRNRRQKGYQLALSFEQVMEMRNFDVRAYYLDKGGIVYSAALVYFHSPEIVQLIYWGTIIEGEKDRFQYLLVYELFSILEREGVKLLDLGTSTNEDSYNSGLLDFKTQIGGVSSMNYKVSKVLS